jgi:hypothetical protein
MIRLPSLLRKVHTVVDASLPSGETQFTFRIPDTASPMPRHCRW